MPPVPTCDDVPGSVWDLPRCSTDVPTLTWVLLSLRRSLVEESVYDDLEAVLGQFAEPTPDEAAELIKRFRAVVELLVQIVPHRVTPYPTAEIHRVTQLSAHNPPAEEARGHLNRFALAVLDVLDLMGDDAQ
jgi:hypothetical protein